MKGKFVVIDLETTGTSPQKGEKIIQFAAVVIEGGKITDQYSTFVNPNMEIPFFIEELTGISDKDVIRAPVFQEIAPKVAEMLEGAYFVAHNAFFDLAFLQEELFLAGFPRFYGPVLDTVEMARVVYPKADSYKLSELALYLNLEHLRPHRADWDAFVTAQIFLKIVSRLKTLPLETLGQLLKLSRSLKTDFSFFLDHLLEEMKIGSQSPNQWEIIRGLAIKKVSENREEKNASLPFYAESEEEKTRLFQQAFSDYEKRDGQFQMMDAVFQSFSEKEHALIEAGTGIGKSLAYLYPAAVFAKMYKEKVVISTYTVYLQEQLLFKDMPILQKMLPFSVKAALLKGRNHYISLAKFEQALKETDDDNDTAITKMQILVWLTETESGDRNELNLSSAGMMFWDKIKSDELSYLENKAWLPYDFYLRARKNAKDAHIIITNHSLLAADIASKQPLLPEYRYCVVDEGHNFEKAVREHSGHSLSNLKMRRIIKQFGIFEQKQYFRQLLQKEGYEKIPKTLKANNLVLDLSFEIEQFFNIVSIAARKKAIKSPASKNRLVSRIKTDEKLKEWEAAKRSGERISFLLRDINQFIQQYFVETEKRGSELTDKERKILEELHSYCSDLADLRESIKKIFFSPEDGFITWIEMNGKSTAVYSQPVSIGEKLSQAFFKKKNSVVITSATLTAKNSFDFIRREIGLVDSCRTEIIPSPYRYGEEVQLFIAKDLPEINEVSVDDYAAAIGEHIISIAEVMDGRMLILFTSYEMLQKTYFLLKESPFLEDFHLIGQGVNSGSPMRLVRKFQRHKKSVLLGTSSFWEGIDIPGEDLSCLVIVRLPFSPPNEPYVEGKCEEIKKKGENPFYRFSLPEAIIKFKQGVGRLIRSKNDRGFIIIFDKRIATTTYGEAFFRSIPAMSVKQADIGEIVKTINESEI